METSRFHCHRSKGFILRSTNTWFVVVVVVVVRLLLLFRCFVFTSWLIAVVLVFLCQSYHIPVVIFTLLEYLSDEESARTLGVLMLSRMDGLMWRQHTHIKPLFFRTSYQQEYYCYCCCSTPSWSTPVPMEYRVSILWSIHCHSIHPLPFHPLQTQTDSFAGIFFFFLTSKIVKYIISCSSIKYFGGIIWGFTPLGMEHVCT